MDTAGVDRKLDLNIQNKMPVDADLQFLPEVHDQKIYENQKESCGPPPSLPTGKFVYHLEAIQIVVVLSCHKA